MFKETHPIIGTRDIKRAIEFYAQQLGFRLAFGDKADPPNYVGFRRDAVELHMQFQFDYEMGTIRLRFLVEDPDELFKEFRQRSVECSPDVVRDTPWMTREFALYDLDRNALTFYRDLQARRRRGSPSSLQWTIFACDQVHRMSQMGQARSLARQSKTDHIDAE